MNRFKLSFIAAMMSLTGIAQAAPSSDQTSSSVTDIIIKTNSLIMRGQRQLQANTIRQINILDDEKIIKTNTITFTGQAQE